MKHKKKVLIVGGGTAGTVILDVIHEHFDVVVFDQSKNREMPFFYRVPIAIGLLFSRKSSYVKKLNVKASNGRRIPFFQSNCLGGASVINGSVHVIGSLDTWHRTFDKYQLAFKNFFSLYESLYTKKLNSRRIRLKEQTPDELDEAFYKSMQSFGVELGTSEFFEKPMCGPIWNTVKVFARSSVLDLGPERLKAVKLDSTVDDIEIENGVVRGVRVGNQIVKADIVILAGGVAGTGSLLCRLMDKLKSGKNEKKIYGIKDHTNIRINVKSKKRVFTLNQLKLKFPKKIFFFLKYWKSLVSIIRGSGASSAANIDLYGDGRVSLRINLLRFHESGRLGSSGELFDNSDCGFSLSLTQINPISHGFVDQLGTIHPGYLSSPEDMNFLTDALKYATNLLQTPPLSEYVDEIVNLDEILINPEKYIRENFYSGYHLIGGSANLIDSEFRVAGIQGLYCCDSSALSEYPSSNIHSSVVILARAFAQRLVQTAHKE